MSTPPRAQLLAELNAALRDVSGLGVLFSQTVAARLGVNSTDLECLDIVVQQGSATAGAIASATGLTTGAITGVIDRLERAGFARREADPADRRRVIVRVPSEAMARMAPLFAPMERASMAALADYDDAQLALLLGFL